MFKNNLQCLILFMFWSIACTSTGSSGYVILKVDGTYDLASITDDCDGLFDTILEISQDLSEITLTPADSSQFNVAEGSMSNIDEISFSGSVNDGTDYDCEGEFTNFTTFSAECQVGELTCQLEYDKRD